MLILLQIYNDQQAKQHLLSNQLCLSLPTWTWRDATQYFTFITWRCRLLRKKCEKALTPHHCTLLLMNNRTNYNCFFLIIPMTIGKTSFLSIRVSLVGNFLAVSVCDDLCFVSESSCLLLLSDVGRESVLNLAPCGFAKRRVDGATSPFCPFKIRPIQHGNVIAFSWESKKNTFKTLQTDWNVNNAQNAVFIGLIEIIFSHVVRHFSVPMILTNLINTAFYAWLLFNLLQFFKCALFVLFLFLK